MILRYTIDKEYDKKFVEGKKQLNDLEKQYKQVLKYMRYSQREYQKSWNEISRNFSDYVEKESGYKWFYQTYYCVISAVQPGISNWGHGPKIIRWWRENAYVQRRITAHELIISHYFEIYKRHYKYHGLTNGQVWALAEIAAFALTSLTQNVKNFWPWDISGYYYDHNYPQLVPMQKKMKTIFLKRKNFDDYIEKGIKLVKEYPSISPKVKK
jgi:hypothetical protein